MIDAVSLRMLASRPIREHNSVLTLFLNVDQSEQSNMNRGFESELKNLLSSLSLTVSDPDETQRLTSAAAEVKRLVTTYRVGARGIVVVADTFDSFIWSAEVNVPVKSRIHWNREVFLQPIAVGLDEHEAYGIVLLDKAKLRLFTARLGVIEEHIRQSFDKKEIRHTKTSGMDQLKDSASHAQRKADEQVRTNMRHVAEDIDWMLEHYAIEHFVLAGTRKTTTQLEKILPKRLKSKVIGIVDVSATATIEQIRAATLPVAEEFERKTERDLVQDLVTSAEKSSSRAVTGLGSTLHAVNQHRAWQLVYADGFRSPGFECQKCSALFSISITSCSLCGAAVSPVDDVVERAVGHAVRKGARIEAVRSQDAGNSLTDSGGIGAFLKTRNSSVGPTQGG